MTTYISQGTGSAAKYLREDDSFNSNFLYRSVMNLMVKNCEKWFTFVEVSARQSWPGTFDTPCMYVWCTFYFHFFTVSSFLLFCNSYTDVHLNRLINITHLLNRREKRYIKSFEMWYGGSPYVYALELCGSSISAIPDPYPYPMMLTRTHTRPVPKIATRLDPTGGYTRTRNLPVGLPLLGIIGLLAYPRPGPLHCISSDKSIFCCGEHVLHASSS